MLSTQSELEELRRQIDRIDDNLLQLLVERLEVVGQVGAMREKTGASTYIPSREAAIIRRLVERNGGELPLGTLVRMWRELLGTAVRHEGPFAVGAFVPPNGLGVWDIARDHFGAHMPLTEYRTTMQAIRAVTERSVTVAVLPMPQDGEDDPWWVHLLSQDEDRPRVVARLPFGPRGNARSDGDALVIGYGAPQPSGSDRTLLATENAVEISHSRFTLALTGLKMTCTFVCSYGQGGTTNTLLEVEGFVTREDARLERLRGQLGGDLLRLWTIGCYAVPLTQNASGRN
ncbi:MAG TPA: chorismate mutase [Stellaceae bacterium]|jgi:chorismate mutase/prephenate dehydratase|nr:chorismate mutase [Stellaceae bacterium]